MNKKRIIGLALVSALSLGILAGCGGKDKAADNNAGKGEGEKVITIGASPTPHAQILEALKPEFKKEGYDLKIVEFTDYVLPNKALVDGDIDANYFQHQPYLDEFNAKNKTDLKSVSVVHYEPMAIFPGKTKKLDDLKDGAKIAIPNDASNGARALLLLADNGLITLKEDAGITATVRDIKDNPKKLEIVEMDAAQIPRALQDVDLAVINGNFAISAQIPFESHIASEKADSVAAKTYANIVAMKAAEKDSEKAKVINKVLTGDACKKFIGDKYKGTVIPVISEPEK